MTVRAFARLTDMVPYAWGLLSRNWRTKGLAVLLALLAWVYAYRGDMPQSREFPARFFPELPAGLWVVDCPIASVTVRPKPSLTDF